MKVHVAYPSCVAQPEKPFFADVHMNISKHQRMETQITAHSVTAPFVDRVFKTATVIKVTTLFYLGQI